MSLNALCHLCSGTIQGLPADPVITAKSLGWHNFHMGCATKQWNRMRDKMVKKEKKTQFRIDCQMVEKGVPTTLWHFFADTLEDAETICQKQMSPDKPFPGFTPLKAGANQTSRKYVNCTITLEMQTGKKTVVDEKTNPLALQPAGQA